MFSKIKSLFSNTPKNLPDFNTLHTDMHSHLIPGIDDGAKSIEDSLKLINELYGLGYRKLITTPHIMSDHFRNTPENILSGLQQVKEALKTTAVEMELEAAAEYYIDDLFVKKLEEEQLLTFGNKYLLFEVSYINYPENIKEIIFNMQIKGYKPVLAHPERYPFWTRKFNEYESFKDSGVLLQINLNSLAGYYGMDAKKTAERLIDARMVDLAGTDLHKIEHITGLQNVRKEKYFSKLIELNLLNKIL
ncbi:MAG: capsular biosynthesis protein [Bacteroidia bacterium]|nr:capsular biosynthesis protein [Bacteroidia bacterium]